MAHVHALEGCHEHGADATVLIAHDETEKRFYAIERIKKRTYALCRLGNWVEEGHLLEQSRRVLKDELPQPKRQSTDRAESAMPWWARAAVQLPQSMTKSPQAPHSALSRGVLETSRPSLVNGNGVPESECLETPAQTPQDVFQELTKQYVEALYLSRTSLAYFTKGPLSRARAALGPENSGELIAVLREGILTSAVMDKKYRNAIVEHVKELPAQGASSPTPRKPTKRKRKWKAKRDKCGFYVDEKDALRTWWHVQDQTQPVSSSAETVDAALLRRIPNLRSRETFLQVVLTLEVLALESAGPAGVEKQAERQSAVIDSQARESAETYPQAGVERPAKAKKKQDLNGHLGTLLDRLCIWNSLDSETSTINARGQNRTQSGEPDDELRCFCIEVVIPFFMSRLPKIASEVNKKLGGPRTPTPNKCKSASSRKPGDPAIRRGPEKPSRMPLKRALSDAINRAGKPVPALQRCITDTDTTSCLKSGSLNTPCDSTRPSRPAQPRKRQSLVHQISFNRREVDLTAMSQASATRLRKNADIEQKLRDAIGTVKKPNRASAVQELATSTDESFAKALAKPRESGKTHRSKSASTVHIAATPKHSRKGVKATPHVTQLQEPDVDTECVQASALRPRASANDPPNSTRAIPHTGHRPRHNPGPAGAVEETPSYKNRQN